MLLGNLMAVFGSSARRYVTPRMAARPMLLGAYHDGSKVAQELVRRYHDLMLRRGNRGAVVELARNCERDHFDPQRHDRGGRLLHRSPNRSPGTATTSPMSPPRRCSSGGSRTVGSLNRPAVTSPPGSRAPVSSPTTPSDTRRWKRYPTAPSPTRQRSSAGDLTVPRRTTFGALCLQHQTVVESEP